MDSIETLLIPPFPKKHISAAHQHFSGMISESQGGRWEHAITKGGKFVEAILKALFVSVGKTPPPGRQFKAGAIIEQLAQLAANVADDTVRLTIPRACRFVYDIASNRGARHDPDEVDPNEMDGNAVVMMCAWIFAEMVRYAQKGAVDLKQAKELIEALVVRRYPLIEEVDGRLYFHHRKKTAPGVALLALAYRYPKRMPKDELLATIERHGFKKTNAWMAIRNIRQYVDEDDQVRLRLLAPGIKKAEEIMKRD